MTIYDGRDYDEEEHERMMDELYGNAEPPFVDNGQEKDDEPTPRSEED